MRRWFFYLSSGFIILALLALAGIQILFDWNVQPVLQKHQATQRQHFNLFLEDITYLEKQRQSYLRKADGGKDISDAGPFLNARVFWAPAGPFGTGAKQPIVPAQVRENLLRFGPDWISQHKKAVRMKADLSFFAELVRYDFWDIESNSPIAKVIKSGNFVPPPEFPLPETSDLLAAAQLRLMKGASETNPVVALQEVRQFANLLISTENLQLVLTGFSILEDERKAYRYYVDELGMNASSWKPVDTNLTRRAHRALWGVRGYLRLWTPAEMQERLFLTGTEPVGFCAASNEAFPLEFALRRLLEPQWPLERNYRDDYARLDRIFAQAKKTCRLKYLRHLVENGNFNTRLPGPFLFNRLPYSRKVFGMRLSVLNFEGFDAYNTLLMKGSSSSGQ